MPQNLDIDKISNAEGIDKKVVEVYSILKKYAEPKERRTWERQRDENWEAVGDTKMWKSDEEEELREKKMVPLVIDKVSKGVQGSAAVVTDSKPEVKFWPVGSGDIYVADLLKRGHDFLWAKNNGQDTVYNGVEECKVSGISFFESHFDPDSGPLGRIKFKQVKDTTCIYWSKSAEERDLSDSHLIKAKRRTVRYIKENYDDIKDSDLIFDTGLEDDAEESEGITGGDNYTIEEKAGPIPDTNEVWEIEAWIRKKKKVRLARITKQDDPLPQLVWLEKEDGQSDEDALEELKAAENIADVELLDPRRMEVLDHRIIVGKKLVSSIENPHGIDTDGDPVPGLIALVHSRTKSSYPTCPTTKALPINREKNKRRSQYIAAASYDINSPIIEPKGTVWHGSPGTPGARAEIPANAAFQPIRLQGGALNIAAFIQLETQADRDIDDAYDMTPVMRGQVPPGQEGASGRLILALQDTAGLMAKPFLRQLETAIVKLAKINVALMLKHWPRAMWERLLEADEYLKPPLDAEEEMELEELQNQPEQLREARLKIQQKWLAALDKIRPEDQNTPPQIGLTDLDIRMTVGSSLPTNRIAKAGVASELVAAGIYDAQAALDYIDDPAKDKIIARMKMQQEQMAMMQLQGGKK